MILLQWLVILIASPINLITKIIKKIRTKNFDPEKAVCPCCGFKGDSGTNYKSCRIECIDIMENGGKAILHTCLRDGAQYTSKPLVPAEKWALYKPKAQELPQIGKSITIQPVVH